MAGELLVTRCDFLGNKMKLLIRLMFHSDLGPMSWWHDSLSHQSPVLWGGTLRWNAEAKSPGGQPTAYLNQLCHPSASCAL